LILRVILRGAGAWRHEPKVVEGTTASVVTARRGGAPEEKRRKSLGSP
jgi:hypothetical protein